MFTALKTFLSPAAEALKEARSNISLEELGLTVDNLKATAKLTSVLDEEAQKAAQDSIKKANPSFDFSDHSIREMNKFLNRVDGQIDRAKRQIDSCKSKMDSSKSEIETWQSMKKDFTALLPAVECMQMLQRKGLQREVLSSLSYTPSPPPAPSHRGAAVSVKKRRCLDLECKDAHSAGVSYTSLLNDLDSFSDNDNENKAPEQHLNYADNNFYSYNNNSNSKSSKINNNLNRGSPSPAIYPSIRDSRS